VASNEVIGASRTRSLARTRCQSAHCGQRMVSVKVIRHGWWSTAPKCAMPVEEGLPHLAADLGCKTDAVLSSVWT
jgi:hypothetical protein